MGRTSGKGRDLAVRGASSRGERCEVREFDLKARRSNCGQKTPVMFKKKRIRNKTGESQMLKKGQLIRACPRTNSSRKHAISLKPKKPLLRSKEEPDPGTPSKSPSTRKALTGGIQMGMRDWGSRPHLSFPNYQNPVVEGGMELPKKRNHRVNGGDS